MRIRLTIRSATFRTLRVALASALMMSVSIYLPALASNWGADPNGGHYCTSNDFDSVCSADDSTHRVYIESDVPQNVVTSLNDSFANDFTVFVSQPFPYYEVLTSATTDKDIADVIVKWDNYSDADPFAYTTCQPNPTKGASGWNKWCKKQQIWIDSSDPYPCVSSTPCREWLVCHEMAHTLGLQHPGTGTQDRSTCTKKRPIPQASYLDGHDTEHLVDCYPHPATYELSGSCDTYEGHY